MLVNLERSYSEELQDVTGSSPTLTRSSQFDGRMWLGVLVDQNGVLAVTTKNTWRQLSVWSILNVARSELNFLFSYQLQQGPHRHGTMFGML